MTSWPSSLQGPFLEGVARGAPKLPQGKPSRLASASLWVMAALNIALGVFSVPLYQALSAGLKLFS